MLHLARTSLPRRATGLAVAAVALLGLSGCGVLAATDAASAAGMMGGASPGTTTGRTGAAGPGGRMMVRGPTADSRQSTCTAPVSLPRSQVTVVLADMDMMRGTTDPAPLGIPMRLRSSTTTAPAGQVAFVAQNLGSRTHELVVLSLPAGQESGARTPGPDGRVAETGSLGEASSACAAGAGEGIPAGSTGWVTLTLAPGRYEVVCNEPNHYADGMWVELDII